MSDSVLIIAYHAVEEGPGPLCLDPKLFDRHLRTLAESGCVALTMSEVAEHLTGNLPFPDRAVALTFDDGYASVHRVALPLLDQLRFSATVFPVTSELGGHNRWDAATGAAPRLSVLDRHQLAELLDAGWDVGGHTHTHRSLPALGPQQAAAEIDTSTALLEDVCQRSVQTFAYPYGHHDPAIRAIAGRQHSVCLTIGARRASLGADLARVDRVEGWYVRQAWQARRVLGGLGDAYLATRRLARRIRYGT